MAKTRQEQTPAMKETIAARTAYEAAQKADETKSTEATKKNLLATKVVLTEALKVENRERFVRVAGGRVKKARVAIRNLSNVANPRTYIYTTDDVDKAEKALTDEVKSAIGKLRNALNKGSGTAKSEDDFSFA
jgi:hypothetical protein